MNAMAPIEPESKTLPEDDECVGTCFACIPDCPRRVRNRKTEEAAAPAKNIFSNGRNSDTALKPSLRTNNNTPCSI